MSSNAPYHLTYDFSTHSTGSAPPCPVSVLDFLATLSIPPPNPQPRQSSSHTRESTNGQSTKVDSRVIRASLEETARGGHDPSSSSLPPPITIKTSDDLLNKLDEIVRRTIRPDAMLPQDLRDFLVGIQASLRYSRVRDERDYYPVLQQHHCKIAQMLYDHSEIYTVDLAPGERSWDIAETPLHNHGKTDLLGSLLDQGGKRIKAVLWEFKLKNVLLLAALMAVWRAADDSGILVSLDGEGNTIVTTANGEELEDIAVAVIKQVIVQLDAYATSILLLSTWHHGVVFHRTSPPAILISRIVPNDPNEQDLRTVRNNPSSQFYTPIHPTWRLFGLVYALLLCADHEEIKKMCWIRSEPVNLANHGIQSKGKRKRKQRGDDHEGNEKEQEQDPRPHDGGGGDGGEAESDEDQTGDDVTLPSPRLYFSGVEGLPIQLDIQNALKTPWQCKPQHRITDRDWRFVNWTRVRPTSTENQFQPFIHHQDGDDCIDGLDQIDCLVPTINSKIPCLLASAPEFRTKSSPVDQFPDDSVICIKPHTYITTGRLYTVFRGTLTRLNVDMEVIIKFVDLESFEVPNTDTSQGLYGCSDALSALHTEVELYHGNLAPLQGIVVPILHGVFKGESSASFLGEREIFCVVLQDLGGESYNAETATETDRSEIKKLYTILHKAGVIHRDVESRHWRKSPGNDGWRLIDFEASVWSERQVDRTEEMWKVDSILQGDV